MVGATTVSRSGSTYQSSLHAPTTQQLQQTEGVHAETRIHALSLENCALLQTQQQDAEERLRVGFTAIEQVDAREEGLQVLQQCLLLNGDRESGGNVVEERQNR